MTKQEQAARIDQLERENKRLEFVIRCLENTNRRWLIAFIEARPEQFKPTVNELLDRLKAECAAHDVELVA